MAATEAKQQKIVILGGGFAGVYCARQLRRISPPNVDIELLSETNYFVFQPLLPEVASGIISAPDAVTSLRLLLPNTKVRMAEIKEVDLEHNWVHIAQGSKRSPLKIRYDHLVIALGQKTDLSRFPGFEEHSRTMRNLADAHGLRNHIIDCLEHADVTEDEDLKRRLLTFVIAGGGFSGVETIGEIQEMIRRALKHYPNIHEQDIRSILFQRGERILPELPAKLGEYAQTKLKKRGVEIRLGASLRTATATAVFLEDGERIDTSTLVTTVGSGPHPLVQNLPLDLVKGKIPTDPMLRLQGYQNVWALGDAALIHNYEEYSGGKSIAPPTAQFAVREAQCVARNILSTLGQTPLRPFKYRPRGALASIGNYQGVAEIAGIRISGLLAWLMWRGVYLGMLPGLSTRLRVGLNWLFDYFLPRNIVQIANKQPAGVRCLHYAKGDCVYRRGQILDGFYAVVDGALESRVRDPSNNEDFVRLIGPGGHWGERSLAEGTITQGSLIALEDTRVLVLRADDFTQLCKALPILDKYFKDIPPERYPLGLRQCTEPKAAASLFANSSEVSRA